MSAFECGECEAIYRELREGASERRATRGAAPEELIVWLGQLNEEECSQMRDSSRPWKTRRRLRKHRNLTGHSVSLLALPPGAISNPN